MRQKKRTAGCCEDLRHCERGLEELCRIAADIARLGNAGDTLQRILNRTVRVVGTRAAYLALVDDAERVLYGIAGSGRGRERQRRFEVPLSQAAAAHAALRRRRAITIRNARKDPRVGDRMRDLLSIGSAAFLPLLGGGSSYGLLILVHSRPRTFEPVQLQLAKYCADLMSVALQNQRLLGRFAVSEGRFRSLVSHLPTVVYTSEVVPPFRTHYIGPELEKLVGYTPAEWMEDPTLFLKLVHPEDTLRVGAAAQSALEEGGVLDVEFRMLDRRGNIRWWRDAAVLVRDPAGRPTAWQGVMIDITASKMEEFPESVVPTLLAGRGRPPEDYLPES